MLLKDIYDKPIERRINPAISAIQFDKDTVETEIQEYVFTCKIMNGLYHILNALKNNKSFNHIGIWIDGNYGSGKSHFLKYLNYLISSEYSEEAFKYFIEAVKAVDPMDDNYSLDFSLGELQDIARWIKNAKIDTSIFNISYPFNIKTNKDYAFINVLWSEFNALRGFNKFNISLAQTLERTLSDKGKFEEFKARIAEDGANWDDANGADILSHTQLDWVLDIAKELVPSIDKESIRQRINERDFNVSVESFAHELNCYLKDKEDNYRLVFLVDEVSQFINNSDKGYAFLHNIMTRISELCGNRVWIVCTGKINYTDGFGYDRLLDKVIENFAIWVSLHNNSFELILQERILKKRSEAIQLLEEKYQNEHSEYDQLFKLPPTYEGYRNAETFAAYYPFVPYQLRLFIQVLNSFSKLGYIPENVFALEKIFMKVFHAAAENSVARGDKIGRFISFDEFYDTMFENRLQPCGQKTIDNILQIASTYKLNSPLALRVAKVLFMICNISSCDRSFFPANLDNITTLLINDGNILRLNLQKEVEAILEFFVKKNIIRREEGNKSQQENSILCSEEEK